MQHLELAKKLFLEGYDLLQSGKFLQAEDKLKQSLNLCPNRASTLTNLSVALLKSKKIDEAKSITENLIIIDPGNAEAYLNLGLINIFLKDIKSALKYFDKALNLKPDYAEGWSNKGIVLHALKRYDQAITCYDKALNLKPDYAEGWSNKGNVLNDLRRHDQAITCYNKALNLKPNYPEAWGNKGVTLYELKRYDQAITCYDKALNLNPDYAQGWSNKGNLLNDLKRYDQAIACYEKALSIKPDIDWVFGQMLHTKMQICNWNELDCNLIDLENRIEHGEKVTPPFALLSLIDSPQLQKKCAEIYANDACPVNPALGPIPKYPKKEKIRIGYYSADFRSHPVSMLLAELFELHNKDQFEIYAFSFGVDDKTQLRDRILRSFDQFIDVCDNSDQYIAELSRQLMIDIAVDLGGYTQNSRPGIFSYRAAPVQVSYLGYLGTLGSISMDYLLGDNTIFVADCETSYLESTTHLPSYQVNDRKRVISNKQFTKKELDIPEEAFVFCCFNNNYKILPETFDSWMRILKATPGSVLFLFSTNPLAQANLLMEANLRDVDGCRIIFGNRLLPDEYLSRYQICDLFLDTFPYNAGTTASDALWAGLPIVTLMGESFASRVAGSLLNAIQLPELITGSRAEYESLAIDLATNPEKLGLIKQKLVKNRLSTPLFDTPLFAKYIESAYRQMYERHHLGLPPASIIID